MAGYRVRFLESAIQDLERLDKPIAKRIARKLRWLAENLDSIKPEPLSAELAGFYKLRAGNYRIIYEILREEKSIVIHAIGHRREIYDR
jgi:mRNA interferase RelE/StbE